MARCRLGQVCARRQRSPVGASAVSRSAESSYPPTFGDKHALVSVEIARLEGRGLDAMRLYEEAIRSAH